MKNKTRFYTYIDDFGNEYSEGDIYFTNSEIYQYEEVVKYWNLKQGQRYPNIFTKGVKWEGKKFPTCIKNKKNGIIASQKVSEKGAKLPIHAGSCRQIKTVCFALPNAGKTTFLLNSLMSRKFWNAVTELNHELTFEEDFISPNGTQKYYWELFKSWERNRQLPGNTLEGLSVTFPYYVNYRNEEALLSITDISGESCKKLQWESPGVILNKYFFVMIDVVDIIRGNSEYLYLIENLLKNIRVHRSDRDYQILVVLTKADRIIENFDKNIFRNSIHLENDGNLYLTVHDEGFNEVAFRKKEHLIMNFLYKYSPNLMNLLNKFEKKRTRFFMTASIGCESSELYDPDNYNPICVDEPWLYILSRERLFPKLKMGEKTALEKLIEKLFDLDLSA